MLLRRALFGSAVAVRRPALIAARGIQTTQPTITKPNIPNTPTASATNEIPSNVPALDGPPRSEMAESVEAGEKARHMQAPNRATTWSKSQRPRALAMVGPRFEQTILSLQPAPYAAIELIHQQPVRWSEKRIVACDGGRSI
jgi:NADH dehydrogenase (ubiquinone) Fe-S protein 6